MKAKRKNGFYWVKIHEAWTIGEYVYEAGGKIEYWLVLGYKEAIQCEDEFDEIDEKAIKRFVGFYL